MDIHIPIWILWTVGLIVGIPAVCILLLLAYVGFNVLQMLSKGIWH